MNLKFNFITDMPMSVPKTSSVCIYFMCMLDCWVY